MLLGISRYIGPELLSIAYKMGHGDEIVLADAFFPGHSLNACTIRCDGVEIDNLLEGLLPLFPIDNYTDESIVMMETFCDDQYDSTIECNYKDIIGKYSKDIKSNIIKIPRFSFYERAKKSFAIVISGTNKKYANIILKKGVI